MNLSKVKTGMLTTMLVGLGVLGLAGCGGDTPTATPVAAPTATTAAMAGPTATTGNTEAVPTETTVMMEEPTATAEMMGEATATTEVMMEEPTATTGTGSTGTGDAAALDLLKKSATAMKAVKSYHISMSITSAAGDTTAEGDLALPDSYRMILTTAGTSTEIIIVGGSSYVKLPGGDQYIESPSDPSLLNSTNAASFAELAQDAKVVGDETIDGAATTHLTFSYDNNAAAAGTGATAGQDLGMAQSDIWIDKSTNLIRQFKVSTDVAGTSSTTTVTYSKFDETIDPPIEKPTNIMVMPEIPTVAVP